MPWLGWACGACEACASGWETLCPDARYTGYMVDGGFAEYVLADAAFAGLVPEGIDPLDAAPLSNSRRAPAHAACNAHGCLPAHDPFATTQRPSSVGPSTASITCNTVGSPGGTSSR